MKYKGEVVDLFCGVGALSHGLKLSGFKIIAGYDVDSRCKHAYENNNDAKFLARDVGRLTAEEIKAHYSGKRPTILAGCAPCQPFSSYKQRYEEDPKWNLVTRFATLAVSVQPDFITMENVPTLLRYKEGRVFEEFSKILQDGGYDVEWSVEQCEKYGVPQRRRRLVVLAAKSHHLGKLQPNAGELMSVWEAIGKLPPIEAGTSHPEDSMHAASGLTPINLRRIKASKPGGTWRDWPPSLRADCHRRPSGKTYPGVYARMAWDAPSPTLTTQCYGYGNGRFGHPDQHRAITLREAAILQSFPDDYEFLPADEKPSFSEVGRWIGNAVPVKLAQAIGNAIASSKPKTRSHV
ncbi:DNA (cytosine-5-)-methyltransferase [Mesorhizobium erdmanii]|uniref:DNA (cytosine-5-)-methyltransferase n=2 Tax=Mesorhizobium TaxID=68287 RepID=A0A3M9XGQ1_9HYPH|nr:MULTISPECIES: DNA cytosine methyltransferase [Mesorhizobium]RNJ47035.1 DNA (cytosine-5-)-methyltransferase [Mesorhizobium japonicum]RXT33962.1 DNA (cytosine-5-)-methyltransferase [Mesorhizobium erdmanii]